MRMHTELKMRLKKLVSEGGELYNAMLYECFPEKFTEQLQKEMKDKKEVTGYIKNLPVFSSEYQNWYSESKAVIKQLLPDRLDDFVKHYEKPKNRKNIEYGNYVISDYLQKLSVTFAGDLKVGPRGAVNEMEQQFRILQSVE